MLTVLLALTREYCHHTTDGLVGDVSRLQSAFGDGPFLTGVASLVLFTLCWHACET